MEYLLYSIKPFNQKEHIWNEIYTKPQLRSAGEHKRGGMYDNNKKADISHDVFDYFEADSCHSYRRLHQNENLRKGMHDVVVAVAADDSNSKHAAALDYGKNSNTERYLSYVGPAHSDGENDPYDVFRIN